MDGTVHMTRRHGWLLLILFAAAFLRMYDIAGTPPGLTHDEADHGITAWEVVNGARQIYFTVGYGREPLFDYSTAALMSRVGPTFLAGRLTAVFFGLILVAALFAFARQAFDGTTALLAAAGLAVDFWPVMTSRQSLRSITLPTLFVLALYFYWRGLQGKTYHRGRLIGSPLVAAGILLGLTFYTYIPARILWVIFPIMLGHLALVDRPTFRRVWSTTTQMLLLTALIGLPLFYYLYTHPLAELRIEQLSAPLTALLQGDPGPLWDNSLASLRLFTVSGDTYWRYNIPGRPFLSPVLGTLFYLGLAIAIWRSLALLGYRQRSTAYAVALIWLAAGMLPVLVTGPELSMTQAIGMQPVLYLFPALGISFLGRVLFRRGKSYISAGNVATFTRWCFLVPLVLFAATAVVTTRDYFVRWANAPEVRVQYETTMVTAMHYLDSNQAEAVTISTTTPGRFHSPAVAQMTLRHTSANLRWFDGRYSLVLPTDRQSLLMETGFARLSPLMTEYLPSAELLESVPLPMTDQDRPLNVYRVNGPAVSAQWLHRFADIGKNLSGPVNFGETVEFLGYDLRTPSLAPGGQVQLVTLWRVKKPMVDALLFTHVQDADGVPLAQADQLSVPGHAWYPGDLFIQLHQIKLPQDLSAGFYPVVVGLCQQSSIGCTRLPILSNELSSDDIWYLTDLSVVQ